MPHDSANDRDDPSEGLGDDASLDGLAIKHLNSKAGRAEIAAHEPADVDDEVTV